MGGEPGGQAGGEVGAQENEKRIDLVFEGGCVKGIGLAGAFCHLLDQGFQPQRVAGTSAGAITAALVAAGYNAADVRRLVLEEMKYKKFEDGGGFPGREFIELLHRRRVHTGKDFEGWQCEDRGAPGRTQ